MVQRYEVVAARAVTLVSAYETRVRQATVHSVERGLDPRTRAFLEERGVACWRAPSADLLSFAPPADRLIEVKGRGGSGPVKVIERQLDTMALAPELVWLYVVFGLTQPMATELYMIRDPAALPWTQTRAATRPPTMARGVRHMAQFEVWIDLQDPRVEKADLSLLHDLGGWVGPHSD